MTQSLSLDTDRRAAVTALSHALTLGMTSLLILALLLGTTGFLDSQRSVTATDELRTIGNRIAGELAHVDELGRQGGAVNLTATHPDRVAGSTYDVRLEHDDGVGPTECADVSADTCLVLTTAEFDIQETIPVHNETEVAVTNPGGGEFGLHSVGTSSSVGAQFTAVDMSSRIGVGEDVNRDSYETLGTPGNDPPLADFDIFPDWPEAGNQVRFDARPSIDRDGNITQYSWDFDDDGHFEEVGADPLVITSLPAGRHNVTLEVIDDGSSVSNFTQEIDVSGLAYQGDLDSTSTVTNGVSFTVENRFTKPVRIERIRIDPQDNSLDLLDRSGGWEVRVNPLAGAGWNAEMNENDGFDIHDGGRVLTFGVDGDVNSDPPAMLPPNKTAEVTLGSFPKDMEGERLTVGLRYTMDGTPNSTIVNDTVGGPVITNYQVFPSGQDVDVQFQSSEPLTTIDVQLGGGVSGTLDRSDFTETGTGPYYYSADVSSGSVGTFWANMTDVRSFGTPSDDTPLNDTAVVTGSVVWETPVDWDNAVSERGLVHASFGDHDASNISIGYSADGNGLVGYWPLDDNSTARDRSGEGNDGSVHGNPTEVNGIGVSSSYEFNGDSTPERYVEVPNDPSLELGQTDRMTVSAWVNKNSIQGGWRAILQHSDQSYNLHFKYGDIPEFTLYDGGYPEASLGSHTAENRWYHYVGTFNESEVRLYVDGVLVDSQPVSDTAESTKDLGIGANLQYGNAREIDGKIDEVRIYERALSPDEVDDLYFAAMSGSMQTNKKVDASGDKDVSNLELQYKTSKAGGQTINVTVHTDEGEQSSELSIPDGTGSINVPGLTTDTDTFFLEISVSSPTVTQSPVIDTLALN